MELNLFWTEFAQKELEKIYEYHKEKASAQIAKKLILGIYEEVIKLRGQPEIGPFEDLLKTKKEGFRYLTHKNYKIIYWINTTKNRVEIIDVFDARQNPIKLKRNK